MVEGRPNFLAVAWVSRVNAKPPLLAVALNKHHFTVEGIRENMSFSVNFPKSDMLEETDYCGLVSGRKVDKSKLFEIFYGKLSTAPMIKKCPLCLECRLLKVQEFPTNDLFIGEIVAAYSEEAYMTDGQLDLQKMDPLLLTMPDNRYWKTGLFAGQAWGAGRKLLRS